jgi:NAD(P)-dependent dehydrogenase (short-subunit alcohol dehydrogenase family)
MVDRDLRGKVAWVTGATSGIGRACAFELADRGAHVVVSGRRQRRLDEVAATVEAMGRRALALPCDVRDDDALRDAVARIEREMGRLDVALANAGFAVGGRVDELDGDAWRQQLDTNVVGAALTARYALPALRRTKGRLALTGSVAAFLPAPSFAAYHCSKHALRALGLTLSAELEGSGVSCTTVHPGFVQSEINQVGNDGQFDAARSDKRPKLLMWPTDRAAKVMVDAIVGRRRELVFTRHGRLSAFLGMHAPWLLQAVMTSGPMMREADSFRVEQP